MEFNKYRKDWRNKPENKKKEQEYMIQYRIKNKEKLKEYSRQYRLKNKDKIKKQLSIWRNMNKEYLYIANRTRDPEMLRQRSRKQNYDLKLKVINHYTNNNPHCQCPKCNVKIIRFLTVDHINGDGAEHKRNIKSNGGVTLWRWIIKNNFPEGFQILCYNCNCSKGFNRVCAHYDLNG